MKKTMIIVSVIATATLTGPAFAEDGDRSERQRHHGGPGMMLRMLDTDADSRVTLEEFLLLNGERFKNADSNADGSLDASEIDAYLAARTRAMRSRMMERLDSDGDGAITQSEFSAPATERFSALDNDSDGAIDRSDMRSHREERRDRGWHHGRGGQKKGDYRKRQYRHGNDNSD